MPADFALEWGTPAPRVTGGPGSAVRAFKQRLCLHGQARMDRESWRMRDAAAAYHALPEGVRVALRAAAKAGLRCDVGSHTSQDRSKYEPRAWRATVRGAVPDEVALVLRLAGFKPRAREYLSGQDRQWWGWRP